MASLKSQRATAPAFMPNDGRGVSLIDKAVLGALGIGTPAVGDTIDFKLPGGVRLADLFFVNDAVDTNGAPTFAYTIGYRAVDPSSTLAPSANYFAGASTALRAAGRQQCVFKPIKFEEDVFVQITVTAVSATLPNGAEIHMVADTNAEGIK